MVELLFSVTVTLVPVPVAGTSPVPVQPVQMYRSPGGPLAGEVTEQVTCDPVGYACAPTGGVGEPYAEITVRLGPMGVKFAVTVAGAVTVRVSGLFVPERAPLQFEKLNPELGVACRDTTVPETCQVPEGVGVIVPAPEGFSVRVSWYSVCQFHVIEEF
jgi:hypothetical protein